MKQKFEKLGSILGRNAQKKISGGDGNQGLPNENGGSCGTSTEAHCFWVGGWCTNQDYGACSGQSNCSTYCVKADGTTYWP